MLRPFDDGAVGDDAASLPAEPAEPAADGSPTPPAAALTEAVSALRSLVLAVERYRVSVASSAGVGTTESQALSFLGTHGDRGQSELARELNLTSSAATALVDRLERRGVAERVRHPSDRRRTIIRLTDRGAVLAERVHEPLLASLDGVEADELPSVARWMTLVADGLRVARPEPA